MVKEIKQLRKQAEKAARAAKTVADAEVSQELQALARAFTSQADVLKSKRRAGKKRR
ncbi:MULTISPECIES: hypothetical protein [Bradyrhizobium]|uniref:hypothetical protein n=1 Tax=Bradyrhizobium TaxID=374 RepID=UPI001911F17E|nr:MULTISPECIES: hypothetical protein [Bradyrhizobium]WOH60386.1 hypothetical protein RX329_09955 [Bradyrhizobium sp. BWC-3-1]